MACIRFLMLGVYGWVLRLRNRGVLCCACVGYGAIPLAVFVSAGYLPKVHAIGVAPGIHVRRLSNEYLSLVAYISYLFIIICFDFL